VPPVRPGDGVQPSAVRADRLPSPAAQDHAMTTMTLTARAVETRLRPLYATGFIHGFEKHHGRVQMYDSTAFILGALLSAGVAHDASLRLEYFLTIPFTCCAFALIVMCATLSMIVVKRQ
jgi:hypothetical protein